MNDIADGALALAEARDNYASRGFQSLEAMVAVTAINRSQHLIGQRLTAILEPYRLSVPRYEALTVLWFSRAEELPIGILASRLMLHVASASYLVDRLVEDGLVERVADRSDRRRVIARLTHHGARIAELATIDLDRNRFGLLEIDDAVATQLSSSLQPLHEQRMCDPGD